MLLDSSLWLIFLSTYVTKFFDDVIMVVWYDY